MINLLPKEEKRRIQNEYLIRFSIATLGFLAASGLVLTTAFLPAYFLSAAKVSALSLQKNELNKSQGVKIDTDVSKIIQDINARLALFPEQKSVGVNVSTDIIESIISLKTDAITIREITYSIDEKNKATISLRGTATTRGTLLDFEHALEAVEHFDSVTLPVSDFIQDRDIDFSIDIRSAF